MVNRKFTDRLLTRAHSPEDAQVCMLVFLGALLSSRLLHPFQLAPNADVKYCLRKLVNVSLLLQTSACMGEHQQAAMWKKMAPLS